jgi:hypothetical protein
VVLVLGVVAVTAVIAVVQVQNGRPPDRRYTPVGWGSEATLEIRDDGKGGLVFAPGIRFVDPPVNADRVDAYRLDWASLELRPGTRETWASAAGSVVQCERAGLSPQSVNVVDGDLRVGGRTVATPGGARHARLSPDGRMAAVLSASGISVPRLAPIPALGGATVGRRSHRFVSIPSGELLGAPIDLGFGTSDPIPCWSPDGRAVIYGDPGFTDVSLVLAPQ